MRIRMPAIAAALLLLPITAMAAEPPLTTAVPAPAAAASTPAAAIPDPAMVAKTAHSLGYKERHHDGKTVYCKSETKVGTTFPTLTCLDNDQVMATVKRSEGNRDTVEALQRAFRAGAVPPEPTMGMHGH